MNEDRTARPRIIFVIGILGVLEAILRLFFYYEAVFAGIPLLQPMPSASTMTVVNGINLALGLAGLVAISGLLLMTRWGYWGTIGVSLVTIAFDGVSGVTVSFTAFAGLILPVIFLVVLLPRRASNFGGRKTT
jgi:hypothetical protein